MDTLGITKSAQVSQRYNVPSSLPLDDINDYFATAASSSGQLRPTPIFTSTTNRHDERSLFSFSPVRPEDVKEALRNSTSSAQGDDDMSIKLYKCYGEQMCSVLADIFNESLITGVYPDQWKSAIVRPLAKLRHPATPSDFRPISLLPALSKVLERVVFAQVMNHCTQHNLLDPQQTAYRRGFSTQSAILRLLDDIRRSTDNGMVTVALFLDLSKAFDSVDHERLLCKVSALGFSDSAIS